MSAQHLVWAFREAETRGIDRLVLIVLAHYANAQDVTSPPRSVIERETNASSPAVAKAIQRLWDRGILRAPPGWPASDVHIGTYALPNPFKEAVIVPPPPAPEPEVRETSPEAAAIARIWERSFEVIPGRRRRPIDDKSRTLIRNALRARIGKAGDRQAALEQAERDVTQALVGLGRSPHHNGQNDRGKKYLDLHYALRGQNGESDFERIQKAIGWARQYAPDRAATAPRSAVWVNGRLENIRRWQQFGHEQERARRSLAELEAAGYRVDMPGAAPWARVTWDGE